MSLQSRPALTMMGSDMGSGPMTDVADVSVVLDRASPIPLYFQVARQIEAAIERGDLRPGQRLDNEVDLADRYGLSRPTMRRAIEELVAKGLLVRKRGVGTQVVHGQVKRPVELSSLYDDLSKTDQQPATQVVSLETVPAEEDVATALGLATGAPVIALERLRYARGEPLAIMRNWLPTDLGALDVEALRDGGLYELLRAFGVHMRIAQQRIGASAATPAEARLLGVRRGAALLTMQRTTYDDTGRPVELGRHVYRADSYTFEITLVGR
jgi:DNA-binding GntR family transcriptional regulator